LPLPLPLPLPLLLFLLFFPSIPSAARNLLLAREARFTTALSKCFIAYLLPGSPLYSCAERVAMIYRIAAVSAVLLSALVPARSALIGANDTSIVKGGCESSSFTAEGPIGTDLTKRQAQFYCDSAIITILDDYKGHMMIQFAQGAAHHSPILGFAGHVDGRTPGEDDRTMMRVDHVYFEAGQATAVNHDGWCTFFIKDKEISQIFCNAIVDETGRRSAGVVTFTPTPDHTSKSKLNPDSPITKPSPSNPLSSKHEMGVDDLAGGSPNDTWERVQSGGKEIFVMTNGRYFNTNPPLSTAEHHSGYGFATYIVANLPESDIVGAPQSIMYQVDGNCETRHYSVLGSLSFSGKNRSGTPSESTPPENVERKLVPSSPFEKAFDMLCKIAAEQK
jgi:hypothetical protein